MVSLSDAPVDLFSQNLPSFDGIKTLWNFVNMSEANRIAYAEQGAAHSDPLIQGLVLMMCGNAAQAIDKLNAGADCLQKTMALGYCYRQCRQFDQAIAQFDKAAGQLEGVTASMEKTETYLKAGDIDSAEKELKNCANFENVSAEYYNSLLFVLDYLCSAFG